MLQSQVEVSILINREHFEAKVSTDIKTLKLKYMKTDNDFHEYIAQSVYVSDFVSLGQTIEWCHYFEQQLRERDIIIRKNQNRKRELSGMQVPLSTD